MLYAKDVVAFYIIVSHTAPFQEMQNQKIDAKVPDPQPDVSTGTPVP